MPNKRQKITLFKTRDPQKPFPIGQYIPTDVDHIKHYPSGTTDLVLFCSVNGNVVYPQTKNPIEPP